jgi:hypothetical protein
VQRLVEGNLAVLAEDLGFIDLSSVRVHGAFVLDMVSHNNDSERYVFQISPGSGRAAMRLAVQAQRCSEIWNRSIAAWNAAPHRQTPGPSQRMPDGKNPPPCVAHPRMLAEVRPNWHPKSSLYNTDGQIFSEAGIPVVLFMEDYDISRTGYHDTQDTMANIDLDYGAALVAIAIESVTAAACTPFSPSWPCSLPIGQMKLGFLMPSPKGISSVCARGQSVPDEKGRCSAASRLRSRSVGICQDDL